MAQTESLPLTGTLTPAAQAELADAVRAASTAGTPMYPIGGGTSLEFGLPGKRQGVGISLAGLNRVVDYPARDMTITVEAGCTMKQIAATLATERQRLPIDVPHAERATIGGVIATNWNGPRRYSQGTVRDFVIGVSAIDGRGTPFKGGGRVVKNVAGYDFCKLLTGSFGSLAIISQVTLKVKPQPEQFAMFACPVSNLAEAEERIATLGRSRTTPAAIELVGGPAWNDEPALQETLATNRFALVVALEGTAVEVKWMSEQLQTEWQAQGAPSAKRLDPIAAAPLWQRLLDFSADTTAPLVLKAVLRPSGVTSFIERTLALDGQCSVQAHAGSGVVFVRFPAFPKAGLSRVLIGDLQPAAAAFQGHVTVLANPGGAEMTPLAVWGSGSMPLAVMTQIKRQFDPQNILNPGRFVFA